MKAPDMMTRRRRLVATTHEGRYAYYLDKRDLYIYQLRLSDFRWVGWLCTLAVWESVFSHSVTFDLEETR